MKTFNVTAALCSSLLLLSTLAAASDGELAGYSRFHFELPPETERMLIADADGDGLSDILTFAGNEVRVFFQRADSGFDFSAPDTGLTLPGRAVGWDLSDNYPNIAGQQVFSLIALIDGQRVSAWQVENRQFTDELPILDGLTGFLGNGAYRLNFSRDVNNDGLDDLIIPGAGELALYIRNPDGSYQSDIRVLSDMQIRTTLSSDTQVDRNVGQAVTIPLMELRDVNNDGRPDLISDTSERFDVFLANPGDGSDYFPLTPSFSIDRVEIRERLGSFDVDQLDFSNLTGVLALTHEEILQDVTGDGIDDVILREGGRVSLYHGSPDGVDFSTPAQILRSGGNVLTTFLHDENGNGRPDLWLWRVEPISVGDLFLWLAISGSINVEAFIYHNDGSSFARRPARRITVSLRFPSAVRMISSIMDVRDRARNLEEVIPSLRANLNDGSLQDLLILLEDQVNIFYDALAEEPEADEDRFLASLNYSRSRDNYEIDIRRLIDEFEIDINRDVHATSSRSPDASLPLDTVHHRGDIMSSDLNGNGRDDIFVFLERNQEHIKGMLLLSDQ